MLNKKAGLEESSLVDPRTNLKIRVSTSTRMKYRKYYSGQEDYGRKKLTLMDYGKMSNVQLNDIIAQDFAASAANAEHMFLSRTSNVNSKKREWIEIRKVATVRPFNFFFSIIRKDHIDVIFVNTVYKRPRKPRVPIKNVDAS